MNNSEIIAQLRSENQQLQDTILLLKEQIDWFTRQIFGKRSEKIIDLPFQHPILPGMEVSKSDIKETQIIEKHERIKPSRKDKDKVILPENLPVKKILIDVSEEKKVSETGEPLVKIGEDISRKLAHEPGSYYIKEIVRPKYADPKRSETGIIAADLPSSLLPRCLADNSFLADLLVKKYADHLPLYRISEILGRENIQISRQLLSQWVLKCGLALKPIYEEMKRKILNSGNVFIDETPIDMLDPGAGQTKVTFMWVLCGGSQRDPPYRVYNFRENRQHRNAEDILKGFQGIVHSDKYGAYETLAHKKLFTWCPCWAHIRRKFFEAEHGDKAFREMVLSKIHELFLIEQVVWEKTPEERLKIRQEEAVPIIDSLTLAVKEKLTEGKVLPKSNFKEALGYYYSLIPFLKNYTRHEWAHLDNNVSERAVRPLAIGRKNWLFLGNEDGGEAAAIILSLIQTCRALNINPRIYLESVMEQLMDYNSQKLFELLPDMWIQNRNSQSFNSPVLI